MIGKNTFVNLSVSYLHNVVDSPYMLHSNPFAPPTDLNGTTLAHSPEWSFRGGIEHTFFLEGGGTIKPNISARWIDEQYVGVYPSVDSLQEAYTVVDGNINYRTANGKWNLNFWIKNAMDEVYKAALNAGNVMASELRMMGVSLNIEI